MALRSNGKRIGISWHAPSGQYRKYVGKQKGRDGSPQPRCFYLGADPQAAMEKALALTLEWSALERQGHVVWPQERCGAAGGPTDGGTKEREVNASEVTLEDAVKIYIAEQESRVLANRVSDRHAEACRHRLSRMLAFMGPERRYSEVVSREVRHFSMDDLLSEASHSLRASPNPSASVSQQRRRNTGAASSVRDFGSKSEAGNLRSQMSGRPLESQGGGHRKDQIAVDTPGLDVAVVLKVKPNTIT